MKFFVIAKRKATIDESKFKEFANEEAKKAHRQLKEIIENEDKDNPLDDQGVTDLLIDAGYVIARRTVTKYRAMMGIPRSKLRREIT